MICNRCDNYEVSRSGVTEICHAKRTGSVDNFYAKLRFSGKESFCKGFAKLNAIAK